LASRFGKNPSMTISYEMKTTIYVSGNILTKTRLYGLKTVIIPYKHLLLMRIKGWVAGG